MNEFELIRVLTRGLPMSPAVNVGPGDDCAVIDLGIPDRQLLLKTDAVVEGIHFTQDTAPEQIGHKALARALSDIAAMAGTPVAALITLALPREFRPSFIEAIYAGMLSLAARHGVSIIGGETTTNPERLLISVSLLGTVKRDAFITRRGSVSGDALFVTGELGGSLDGHHLSFEPRLAEGRWLASHFRPHSMIDLSDGLAGDLRHLLREDGLGATLMASSIPIRRAATLRARASDAAKPALVAALTDGEDFELLFTVPPASAVPLLDAWKIEFPAVRLTCIGKIRTQPGILLCDKTGSRELQEHGYVHFA